MMWEFERYVIRITQKTMPIWTVFLFSCELYDSSLLNESASSEGTYEHLDGAVDAEKSPDHRMEMEEVELKYTRGLIDASQEQDGQTDAYSDVTQLSEESPSTSCSLNEETCDGLDNDCDGLTDEGYSDTNLDGIADCMDMDSDTDGEPDSTDCEPLNPAVNHSAEELCDGKDNNCDGSIDEDCPVEFRYSPSNFNPQEPNIASSKSLVVNLNCGESSFDSSSLEFGNFCGQDQPKAVLIPQDEGPSVVVLSFRSLSIAADSSLKLRGEYPVILAVYGDAQIDGWIDASASGVTPGPGGDNPLISTDDCTLGTGEDGGGAGSITGGGGGGYGAGGGNGGNLPDPEIERGGSGGAEDPSEGIRLIPLRSGCAGGRGQAAGQGADEKRYGGAGGGGIQISAASTLTIAGGISSAGGGGTKGQSPQDGGGGGGSGGAILLEGEIVKIESSATITANGGSAAAGNSESNPNGQDGADGEKAKTTPVIGGTAHSGAGNGGNGGAVESPATMGEDAEYGGGGGGGSVGRIRINRCSTCSPPGVFSPSPSIICQERWDRNRR